MPDTSRANAVNMENTNFKKRQVTKENAKGNIKSWPLVFQGTINKYFELICNFTNSGSKKNNSTKNNIIFHIKHFKVFYLLVLLLLKNRMFPYKRSPAQ